MRSVIIWATPFLGWLWLSLAERFKRDGARVELVCNDPRDVAHFQGLDRGRSVDAYTDIDWLRRQYGRIPAGPDEVTTARGHEDRFGAYLVDEIQNDRHWGRGFFSSGLNFPASRPTPTYRDSLTHFNRIVEFWDRFLDERRPDLWINVPGGMEGLPVASMARTKGIPIRVMAWARYKDYYYWAPDEFWSSPQVARAYQEAVSQGLEQEPDMASLRPFQQQFRDKFLYGQNVFHVFKRMGSYVVMRARKRWRGLYDSYSVRSHLAFIWREHRVLEWSKRHLGDGRDLEGLDYILYPLHVEPEHSLNTLAPDFTDQQSLIYLLAKNLPAGVYLAVKEHVHGMGARPRGFYDHLALIPNVKLISPLENTIQMAAGSLATVVISSTVGGEAASLGVPVLSLGVHNVFNVMPHVRVVTDFLELRRRLREILDIQDETSRAERLKSGRHYIAALKRSCLDLTGIDLGKLGPRQQASPEETDLFYTALMRSLQPDASPEA